MRIDASIDHVRKIQLAIASVFVVLGAWCVVSPGSVIGLTVRDAYRTGSPLVAIAVGAFGAQAMLAGLLAATTRFTRATFLWFGMAIVPFLLFDGWFYSVVPVFNELILLDAAGNVALIALCACGYRVAPRAEG